MVEGFLREHASVTVDLYPFDSGSTALKETIEWNIFSPQDTSAMFSEEASDVVIVSCEKYPELIGKNIAELAEEYDLTPEETAKKLVGLEDGILIAMKNCISEDNIVSILKKSYSMIGSDGIPTKSGFSNPRLYGTFPRVLGRYSREKKVLTVSEAVYKMSGFPASRFRLKNRGIIKEGAAADIVIFSYDEIADKADYSNPRQYPVGVRDVFVNGVRALKEGAVTGKRAGRALTRE